MQKKKKNTQAISEAIQRAAALYAETEPFNEDLIRMQKDNGFTRTSYVLSHADYLQFKDRAEYFRNEYPDYMFLTDYQLTEIEDDFNLQHYHLDLVTGVGPDAENIVAINEFRIKKGDINKTSSQISPSAFAPVKDHFSDAMDSLKIMIDKSIKNITYGQSAGKTAEIQIPDIYRPSLFATSGFYLKPNQIPYIAIDEQKTATQQKIADHMNNMLMSFTDIRNDSPAAISAMMDSCYTDDKDKNNCVIILVRVNGGYLVVTDY